MVQSEGGDLPRHWAGADIQSNAMRLLAVRCIACMCEHPAYVGSVAVFSFPMCRMFGVCRVMGCKEACHISVWEAVMPCIYDG